MKIDCNNALICFHMTVLYNTNCRPPNFHHNILLMHLWEVFRWSITIKTLNWLFTVIIKGFLFVTNYNLVKKGIIGVMHTKHWADFKSPKFLILIELMRDQLMSLFAFSMLYKWREIVAVSETFFSHFEKDFFNNYLQFFPFKTACTSSIFFHLQDSHLHYGIFGTTFILSNYI